MAELTKEQAEISVAFVQKLIGLGIKAQMTRIEPGPVVTGYYYKLDHTVPINKIMSKSEDFALSAAVEKVQITRIGGEIVIFASNRQRQLVDFKDYLHWFCTSQEVSKMQIPIALGVDTLGKKTALDLAEMPHILLAGETGSGKSVFESAIICSLVVAKKPTELQINLVDTKQVDLPMFSGLPHVKCTVEELGEFHSLMDSLLNTIYKRMDILKNSACRNIREYHGMMGEDGRHRMPYIVTIIDEFGDLLEQDRAAKKSKQGDIAKMPGVETWLKRIVQISRAAGVHIIAGTQRTSVKIISGDTKANFPCRISLRLTTEADSRTILGTSGAEYLLGKGDMYIQAPGSEALKRYHGAFVNLADIANILDQQEYLRDMFSVQRGDRLGV